MRKFSFIHSIILAMLGFVGYARAQGSLQDVTPHDFSFAPLYLLINGAGSITPFQNGDMLQVGQSYEMTAVPDSGFVFSSWQPVNVFIMTSSEIDYNTTPPSTNIVTSTNFSPVPTYTTQETLDFFMQSEQVLYDTNGSSLTQAFGWQANFVPVPEPATAAVILLGLTGLAICLFRPSNPKVLK